jgi:NADH-quinone oxidoreductase subunit N
VYLNVPIYQIVLPMLAEIGLLVLLLLVLSVDLFLNASQRRAVGLLAGVGMLVVLALNYYFAAPSLADPAFAQPVLGGMLRFDMLALMFRSMIILAGALTCFISLDSAKIGKSGEFYAVVIVATLGMSLMSAAADLIMVFVALETASISLYILAGYLRDNPRSSEAGIKYFLFGSFTAGLFLYGLSLLYGFTGSTSIYALAAPLSGLITGSAAGAFGVVIAMLLVLAGFGFKISAVPFHFWTPDVYEGAPTPVTAFISTASKAASFALLMRVFGSIWPTEAVGFWTALLAAISLITMTLGNLLALSQTNIKRMLAYSSIAQAGYALMGVLALAYTETGVAAVAFYMFMYILTNMLAFAVVIAVGRVSGSEEIKDFASLSRRSPVLALGMALALLSLGGIPPAAGFFGKFYLFAAAVEAGYVWLAIAGVLNAIVALYYYLTVIKIMYVDPSEDKRPLPLTAAFAVVLVITGAGILWLGTLGANQWWNWALEAAHSVAMVR